MSLTAGLPRAGWPGLAVCACAGMVAALGLAPFDLWVPGLIGFACGLWLVGRATAPVRAAWGFGFGYFALALHWIIEPFLVDIARHGWMAPFALVLMAGFMALFWALAAAVAQRLRGPFLPVLAPWLAQWLALWLALAEGLRAYLFSGFPWAHPGHILIDTPVLGLAAWVGPLGLTVVVLAVAALLASVRWIWAAAAMAGLAAMGWVFPVPPPLTGGPEAPLVRLIQPNAPQHLKWQPEMIPVFYARGQALSQGTPVDLIIWPETSLPVTLEQSVFVRAELAEVADGAQLIIGAQRFEGRHARNALVVLDAGGAVTELYDKHHLVPFGEYVPLQELVSQVGMTGLADRMGGGFWPGPGPGLLELGALGRAFPMICYEAIFPQYLRQVDRPDWQLHITNDAWFGSLAGPYQHLALARLRAAESGLPLLRAANTGVTAAIDARGQVIDHLPLNTAGALDVALPPSLPLTLYARTGDLPVLIAVLLTLFTVSAVFRKTDIDPDRLTD